MLPTPWTRWSCCSSCCSLTASAVGLTELGCWAATGAAAAAHTRNAIAATAIRMRAQSVAMAVSFFFATCRRTSRPPIRPLSGCDVFAIRRLPSPGAGAVATLGDAILVNLGDDLSVAGEQRLGRAHLRAQRQFARRQTVGAVLLI